MNFWLRACPKCHGDLEMKRDVTGPFVECMQCGGELSPIQQNFLTRVGYISDDLPQMVAPPVLTEGRRLTA